MLWLPPTRPASPWSRPDSDTSSTDVSRRFGEEGRELSYGTYLKVPELLHLQEGLSQEHDELLFIVAHQVYELWFKVVLFELEAARDRIDADDLFFARHHLQRVRVIEKLLVEQIGEMEHAEFLDELNGLIQLGYVLCDKVNVRTMEDVERAIFRVNASYARELRDAIQPGRRREREQRRRRRG